MRISKCDGFGLIFFILFMLKLFSDYLVLLDRALSSLAPSEIEIFHIFHMNGFVQALTVNISREKKTSPGIDIHMLLILYSKYVLRDT